MLGRTAKSLGMTLFFKGSSLGVSVLIVRWYVSKFSVEDLAVLNLQNSFITTLMVMITFALPEIINRFYIKFEEHEKSAVNDYWTTMFYLRLGSFWLGIVLLSGFLGVTGTNNFISALGLYLVQFIILMDLNFRMISDALNQSWRFSATDLMNKSLLCLGLYALPIFENSLRLYWPNSGDTFFFYYYIILSIISITISFLTDWVVNLKYIGFGDFKPELVRKELKSIMAISITTIVIALYSQTDKLFMQAFGLSNEEINGYSIAYRLFESLTLIPVLTVPTLAMLIHKHREAEPAKARKIRWSLIGVALGSTALALIIRPVLLQIVDSQNKYIQYSSNNYVVLSFGLIPLTISSYYVNKFIFNHNEKFYLTTNIFTLIVAFIGYTVLIPKFGSSGAAIATTTYFVLNSILQIGFDIRQKRRLKSIAKK